MMVECSPRIESQPGLTVVAGQSPPEGRDYSRHALTLISMSATAQPGPWSGLKTWQAG